MGSALLVTILWVAVIGYLAGLMQGIQKGPGHGHFAIPALALLIAMTAFTIIMKLSIHMFFFR